MKNISLYYKGGSSDKVYQIQTVPEGDGFVVNFQYGRQGSTLQSGTKTAKPVEEAEAIKIFDKLVREKQAKGYTEGESGTPYSATSKEDRATDLHVQLLNPLDPDNLKDFLIDKNFGMQEKLDGKRMLLVYDGSKVYAVNRNGLICGAPENILQDFESVVENTPTRGLVIDGECIGEVFHAFDVLKFDVDVTHLPCFKRLLILLLLLQKKQPSIVLVPTYAGEVKTGAFDSLKKLNREGVVFKNLHAPYSAGRPASGGNQFKFKFQAEATCRVAGINGAKRSFSIEVRNGDGYINVGNCTVPANKEIPKVGDLVEIRYLYAFPTGALYQPFFKGVRDDKTEADLHDSLKFKSE